jgi:hypothetical protein
VALPVALSGCFWLVLMECALYRRFQFLVKSLNEMSNAGIAEHQSPWRFAIAPMMDWMDTSAFSSEIPE